MGKTVYMGDLSEGIKSGDTCSFEKLYKLMSKKIFQFAYSFLPVREDAEEIVHDVFIKIWERRKELDNSKSLQSYIYTIAKNATLDKIKMYSVENVNLQEYCNTKIVDINDDNVQSDQTLEIIKSLVEQMPFQRRKIFKLNKFQGMSQKSISEYLNISQGCVEKHISKALKFIKEELSKRNVSAIFFLILSNAVQL